MYGKLLINYEQIDDIFKDINIIWSNINSPIVYTNVMITFFMNIFMNYSFVNNDKKIIYVLTWQIINILSEFNYV